MTATSRAVRPNRPSNRRALPSCSAARSACWAYAAPLAAPAGNARMPGDPEIDRDVKLGKLDFANVSAQAAEILVALKRLGEPLAPKEEAFLAQNKSVSLAEFEAVAEDEGAGAVARGEGGRAVGADRLPRVHRGAVGDTPQFDGPAQCDLRVGDATYMPRTLAAPSPTTAEREKRKEREEKREKNFGARVARAAATGYLHREGQNWALGWCFLTE